MGLWNSIFELYSGVDLEAEDQRARDSKAQLRALNEKDYAPGGRLYEKALDTQGPVTALVNYQTVEQHLDIADAEPSVTDQVQGAFAESLEENTRGVRKGIGTVVSIPFKLIPWQVWLLLLLALFVYMGGHTWLRGRLSR